MLNWCSPLQIVGDVTDAPEAATARGEEEEQRSSRARGERRRRLWGEGSLDFFFYFEFFHSYSINNPTNFFSISVTYVPSVQLTRF
jgi:hypothetical protein